MQVVQQERQGEVAQRSLDGWFMVIDPATGLILTVREMMNPENNSIALEALKQTMSISRNIDCVVYDRACALSPGAEVFQSHQSLVC